MNGENPVPSPESSAVADQRDRNQAPDQFSPISPSPVKEEKQASPKGKSTVSSKVGKAIIGVCVFVLFATIAYAVYAYLSEPWSEPQSIRVTNVTSRSATVSWVTEDETRGVVLYSEGDDFWPSILAKVGKDMAHDDRDVSRADLESMERVSDEVDEGVVIEESSRVIYIDDRRYYTHHVTVSDLDPEKKYYFLVGNGLRFVKPESEVVQDEFSYSTDLSLTTLKENDSISVPNPTYGTVIQEDGTEIVDDGVVFMVVHYDEKSKTSAPISGVLNDDGNWYLDLGNVRTLDGEMIEKLDEDVDMESVYVMAGMYGESDVVAIPMSLDAPMRPIEVSGNAEDSGESSKSNSMISYVWAACEETEYPEAYCKGTMHCEREVRQYEDADGNCAWEIIRKDLNCRVIPGECGAGEEPEPEEPEPEEPQPEPSEPENPTDRAAIGKHCQSQAGVDGVCKWVPNGCSNGHFVNRACPGGELVKCCIPEGQEDPYDPGSECRGPSQPDHCYIGNSCSGGGKSGECQGGAYGKTNCTIDGKAGKYKSNLCGGGIQVRCCLPTGQEGEEVVEEEDDKCPMNYYETRSECEASNCTDCASSEFYSGCYWCHSGEDVDPPGTCPTNYFETLGECQNSGCTDCGSSELVSGCFWCFSGEDVNPPGTCPTNYFETLGECQNSGCPDCAASEFESGCYFCHNPVPHNVSVIPEEGCRVNIFGGSVIDGKTCHSDRLGQCLNSEKKYKCVVEEGTCVWDFNIGGTWDDCGDLPVGEPNPACPDNGYVERDDCERLTECWTSAYGQCERYNEMQNCWVCKEGDGSTCRFTLSKSIIDGRVCNTERLGMCLDSDMKYKCVSEEGVCTWDFKIGEQWEECDGLVKSSLFHNDPSSSEGSEIVSMKSVLGQYAYADKATYTITDDLVIVPESDGVYSVNLPGIGVAENVRMLEGNEYRLYLDMNGNGQKEEYEEYVVIEGLDLEVTVDDEREVFMQDLEEGYNYVSFEYLPSNPDSCSFIGEFNSETDIYDVTLLARFESGTFEVTSYRADTGDKPSGDCFPIVPGRGYVIRSYVNKRFVLDGYPLLEPAEVGLDTPGWHLIGINGASSEYTALEVLESVNLIDSIRADNLTKWLKGSSRYEGLQQEGDEVYGFDYDIEDDIGYFVHIAEGRGIWQPE